VSAKGTESGGKDRQIRRPFYPDVQIPEVGRTKAGQFTTEGVQQRIFISAEWSGEAVELSYKGVKVGIALLEAFELALIQVFLI
jgi:hypothetical protein